MVKFALCFVHKAWDCKDGRSQVLLHFYMLTVCSILYRKSTNSVTQTQNGCWGERKDRCRGAEGGRILRFAGWVLNQVTVPVQANTLHHTLPTLVSPPTSLHSSTPHQQSQLYYSPALYTFMCTFCFPYFHSIGRSVEQWLSIIFFEVVGKPTVVQ